MSTKGGTYNCPHLFLSLILMNNKVIAKAKRNNIKDIVKIHKKCVVETNANTYDSKVIETWLEQINEKKCAVSI